MTGEDSVEEALYLAEENNKLYIRATGHVTAQLCAELKARVFDRLDLKPPVDAVYVDLSQCEYMDSTFMGLLVGFNKRFLRLSERPISVLRANDVCKKLLSTIGVARLVDMSDDAIAFPAEQERIGALRQADAALLLDAHDNLIELSDENERKFSALRSVLSDQIDKQKDGGEH